METDPGALEEGQRLLDMESPSKRSTDASTPQELAANVTSARNKILKLGRSGISKINIVPDPQATGSPGEPSKKESDKTECILTEPVMDKGAAASGSSTSASCGSTGNKKPEHLFPPAYYSVRKMRYNSMPTQDATVNGDARSGSGSGAVRRAAGDDRRYTVKNFHIPAYKRNVSSSISNDGGLLECVSCETRHVFDGTDPVCLVLSDQNFPPHYRQSWGSAA
jgi:hypothetical protein